MKLRKILLCSMLTIASAWSADHEWTNRFESEGRSSQRSGQIKEEDLYNELLDVNEKIEAALVSLRDKLGLNSDTTAQDIREAYKKYS